MQVGHSDHIDSGRRFMLCLSPTLFLHPWWSHSLQGWTSCLPAKNANFSRVNNHSERLVALHNRLQDLFTWNSLPWASQGVSMSPLWAPRHIAHLCYSTNHDELQWSLYWSAFSTGLGVPWKQELSLTRLFTHYSLISYVIHIQITGNRTVVGHRTWPVNVC